MEVIDIKTYRANAAKENLCQEFTRIWDSCKTSKELMDMALCSKGCDYICDSIAKGWGISPSYISKKFKYLINGNYVSKQHGYESEMFCQYKGLVIARTTNIVLIDCDMEITIPKFFRCDIYVSGKSNIRLKGNGEAVLICYGDESNISHSFEAGMKVKRLNKKERDTYE